jgi:hypothetical protein
MNERFGENKIEKKNDIEKVIDAVTEAREDISASVRKSNEDSLSVLDKFRQDRYDSRGGDRLYEVEILLNDKLREQLKSQINYRNMIIDLSNQLSFLGSYVNGKPVPEELTKLIPILKKNINVFSSANLKEAIEELPFTL